MLVFDLDHFIRIDVHNRCPANPRNGIFQVVSIEMGMTVKKVTGLRCANQEIECFESLMCQGFIIVDAKGGGVCDENIQFATGLYPLQ
jgi:hypothetical protein